MPRPELRGLMKRREFISLLSGAVVVWPLGVGAQQPAMPVVGFLNGGTPGAWASFVSGFRRGLTEAGFVEGRNVAIEFRWAEGLIDRVPGFIADLTQRQVAVIFVGGSDAVVLAAKSAISSVPIVFATGGDPVEYGIVASLNRPAGNATGVTIITAALWPKRLELLRELASSKSLFGVLVNPNHPSSAASTKDVREAARTLGQEILVVNARTERDIDMAFDTLVQQRVNGLLVANDPLFTGRREQLIALASRYAIPTVYDRPEFTKAGGLMSYGASTVDQYRQAGFYTGRVLKGEKPADLPVLQPTKFELSVNLKTAKALGLTVPPSLVARADEVIE